MNQDEVGETVARLLDRGLGDIRQGTSSRLQLARRTALKSYDMAQTRIRAGQGALAQSGPEWRLATGQRLSVVALLVALAGILYWPGLQQVDENEETDIMLLTDDLPVEAYLDNELDTWLDPSWQ
ncbi:MAG: DUF3619 family protein [Nitrosospira sp.]|nr:DUF3619 family protein [Nitrosospira sp.]